MELIRRKAYARAGLIGNPSDGYNGKTISVIFRNYWAEVTLYEWDRVEIVPSREDETAFRSVHDLVKDVRLHGYYGGIRLVKAAIRGFVDYCTARSLPLHNRNFSIRYETTIPRQVGLAGSSAIVVATIRALCDFYSIEIPKNVLPSLVLSIEREQLGIPAGLQDRVIQVYEGAVYMDFGEKIMVD
ncbi:MAG: mevalonate kinase family protein, partial [Thermoguttaceae bacterium]